MNDADEEKLAANALGEILASVLLRAYEEPRTWLYCWERDGLRWLLRYRDRRSDWGISMWTSNFLDLNRDAILSDDGKMDFNLRAHRLGRSCDI